MALITGSRRLVSTATQTWRIVWTAAPRELVIVFVCQAVAALALAGQLIAAKELLTAFTSDAGQAPAGSYALLLFGLGVSMVIAGGANAVVDERRQTLIELIQRHLEEQIISVVVGVDIEQLDDPHFHDRHQRALAAFVDRPWDLMNGIVSSVGALLGIAAIGAVLVPINVWLFPTALLGALPLGLASIRNSQTLYAQYRDLAATDRRRAYFRDVLTSPRSAAEVRLFDAVSFMLPRYRELYDERVAMIRRLGHERTGRSVGVRVGFALFAVAVIAWIIHLTNSGMLDLAEAALALVVVQGLFNQLRAAASAAGSMHESSLFLPDLTSFLETPLAADGQHGTSGSPQRRPTSRASEAVAAVAAPESLIISDLSFTYPGGTREVLHEITLHIDRGEVVALVGPNGAGKSTLVKVLCGLYEPSRGTVAAAPDRHRPLSRPELRGMVTAVFQDFGRYELTARENIAFGEMAWMDDDEAVHEAAQQAGIASAVRRLPHGYDTLLSRVHEGGTDLSVGQWQRLALARALFRSAPFMVLDEPTAASDAVNERAFLDNLRRTCKNRGVLLITHRMSTARRADRTYVISDGRIIESGTHEELSRKGGIYANLHRLNEGQ